MASDVLSVVAGVMWLEIGVTAFISAVMLWGTGAQRRPLGRAIIGLCVAIGLNAACATVVIFVGLSPWIGAARLVAASSLFGIFPLLIWWLWRKRRRDRAAEAAGIDTGGVRG